MLAFAFCRNSYMARRKRMAVSMPTLRSAITNGSAILGGVDHRTAWMRRLKDLLAAFYTDLGGEDVLSEGQRALVRRSCMMELQLEMLDAKFGNNGGSASTKDLDLYGRTSGNLRRVIETLGLHRGRRPRLVNGADVDDANMRAYEKALAEFGTDEHP
jgi:hypothetical protein